MPVTLITGVTGQDGSYLAERLLADGEEVHGLVYAHGPEAAPTPPLPAEVHAHPGDLADADGVRRLVEEVAPDTVYNLAGISSVGYSWQHPGLTARLSGVAALELMDTALGAQESFGRPVRFVQASSAEIFGETEVSPQDESTPLAPVSPYGMAKAMAHQGVHAYRRRGLHAVSCILYNHESPRRPTSFVTRKITRAVAQIHHGHAERLVLGNLDARRDWGWAPDYVEAMVLAARHHTAQDYVIATGVGHSVRDFVAAAFARVGVEEWTDLVEVDPDLVRPVDPHDQRGDATRARDALGWRPSVDFAELVGRMVDADLDQLSPAPGAVR